MLSKISSALANEKYNETDNVSAQFHEEDYHDTKKREVDGTGNDDDVQWLESGSSFGSIDEERDYLGGASSYDNQNPSLENGYGGNNGDDDVRSIGSSKSSIIVSVEL